MIATIVLDINGVKIELTQAQAKELHKLLGSLTGKDMVEYVPVPYQVPVYPAPYRTFWTYLANDTTATLTLSNTEA